MLKHPIKRLKSPLLIGIILLSCLSLYVLWAHCLCVFLLLWGRKCSKLAFSMSVYVWLSPQSVTGLLAPRQRLQEGQIQNQWENSSAVLNSISAKQDPLRGARISEPPNGRIVNVNYEGKRRDERKRRKKWTEQEKR